MAVSTTWNYIGETIDGLKVFDREDSHLHSEGGLTLKLLRKGLGKIYFPKWRSTFKKYEVDFKHPIGFTTCVRVTEDDEVVMVYRKGREGMTPMVKNREAEPCEWLTIILRKEENLENHATLITAYIGAGSPPEPWDKRLSKDPLRRAESEAYWSTHALVYNADSIDWDRTVFKIKP